MFLSFCAHSISLLQTYADTTQNLKLYDHLLNDYAKHAEQNEYYKSLSASKGTDDVRGYVEAILGRQSSAALRKQRQYLVNDRKV